MLKKASQRKGFCRWSRRDRFPCLPSADRLWFDVGASLGLQIVECDSFPSPSVSSPSSAASPRSEISLLGSGSSVRFSSVPSLDFLLTYLTGASWNYDLHFTCLTPFHLNPDGRLHKWPLYVSYNSVLSFLAELDIRCADAVWTY